MAFQRCFPRGLVLTLALFQVLIATHLAQAQVNSVSQRFDKTTEKLQPFSSDGCSLFPDNSQIARRDWCSCCFAHDVAYWQGGTREQRLHADIALRECVVAVTESEPLGRLMYEGVRLGGSPYFYNWYRWGYGWPYGREYRALTGSEREQVEQKLMEYLEDTGLPLCGDEIWMH